MPACWRTGWALRKCYGPPGRIEEAALGQPRELVRRPIRPLPPPRPRQCSPPGHHSRPLSLADQLSEKVSGEADATYSSDCFASASAVADGGELLGQAAAERRHVCEEA